MLGSLAEGQTIIDNFLDGDDCLATMNCFKEMGVSFQGPNNGKVIIDGLGLYGLKEPTKVLNVENSGTTIRLMSGILAGQDFFSIITGDESLTSRPMGRVIIPLGLMGAKIWGRKNNTLAPMAIKGGNLNNIDYTSPVASAQVKSSVLLAGLYCQGWSYVNEPSKSRDHTERMLEYLGAEIDVQGNRVGILGGATLKGANIKIPGDISSAAFLMVAAAITPNSDLTIVDTGINPTRDGIIEALTKMGADIKIYNKRTINGEPIADIQVKSSQLTGTVIEGSLIPRLIDEIPVLAVAATSAKGETIIKDAEELKVKESNRISSVAENLRKFGADIIELKDGLRIRPGAQLKGAEINPKLDHRIAMSMAVAGLVADGTTTIRSSSIADVSFPNFFGVINKLMRKNND